MIQVQSISKSFSQGPLFRDLSLVLDRGEHIGLIGENGTGKSTLLKIIAKLESPDSGQVVRSGRVQIGYVAQTSDFSEGLTVYEQLAKMAREAGVAGDLIDREVGRAGAQFGFSATSQKVTDLSGGWQKRLALAGACFGSPDLLLLDEPTNHLDWETVLWLEGFLRRAPFAWLMVTHDRYLLQNCVTRVIELTKMVENGVLSTQGFYDEHLERRRALKQSLEAQVESMSNKMRREDAWLRAGVKARGTKAKGRIDAAENLREQLSSVRGRTRERELDVEFSSSGRKTKKLLEIKKMGLRLGELEIFQGFSDIVQSRQRIGILGPNGCGKTSLLRCFLGELKPHSGELIQAKDLKVVYFDQKRSLLDLRDSLKNALCPDGDHVVYGESSYHVAAWAKRFGFSRERLDTLVGSLSGGERARVAIAKLVLQPADILLLDEPTNDLDIATIEILEQSLLEFKGAILLISHDRYLMGQVCQRYWGFCGRGALNAYASVSQWIGELRKKDKEPRAKNLTEKTQKELKKSPVKLSYKEKYELQNMEQTILEAEGRLQKIKEEFASQDHSSAQKTSEYYSVLSEAEKNVADLYERWTELSEKNQK